MTTPIFSKEYVLEPVWNDVQARVSAKYQDSGTSDALHRIAIPAGVWMVSVANEARFTATPVFVRNGRDKEYSPVVYKSRFQVQSESGGEMYFRWGGTPNTNDAAVSRMGVTLVRMAGFDI